MAVYLVIPVRSTMRTRRTAIPDSDLETLSELVNHISAADVVEKWDVCTRTLTQFFKRHGTTIAKERIKYRLKVYNEEIIKGKKVGEVAKLLGISSSQLHRATMLLKDKPNDTKTH